jgi:purine-binding chemotaxis protein CheW
MASSYLTFRLATETYVVALESVSEIAAYPDRIARIPTAPDWVRGVFNLRGSVVPVLDLRLRLRYEASQPSPRTCVLITHLAIETLALTFGMIVDSVDNLLEIETAEIESPPAFGSSLRVDCLLGTVRRDGAELCVLDLPRMFKNEELLAAALTDERGRAATAQIELERQKLEREAQRRNARTPAPSPDMGREDPALPGLFLFEDP